MNKQEKMHGTLQRQLALAFTVDTGLFCCWLVLLLFQPNYLAGSVVAVVPVLCLLYRLLVLLRFFLFSRGERLNVVRLHGAQNTFQTMAYLSYYQWLRNWTAVGYLGCVGATGAWCAIWLFMLSLVISGGWTFLVAYTTITASTMIFVFLATRRVYNQGVRRNVRANVTREYIKKMADRRVEESLRTLDPNLVESVRALTESGPVCMPEMK